jgi:hypothetical protein
MILYKKEQKDQKLGQEGVELGISLNIHTGA